MVAINHTHNYECRSIDIYKDGKLPKEKKRVTPPKFAKSLP